MDQTSATSPTDTSAPPQQPDTQAAAPVDTASAPSPPGFGARGRVRRRVRFLRKARELAYRDLGGLVFSLHRFGQRNDSLVLAKLATLSRIDGELRTLESSLSERQPVTVLREAGITACPRCAAIHGGEDRFCPNCGLSMSRRSDLPIAGAPPAGAPAPATSTAPPPAAPTAPGAPLAPPPAAPAFGAAAPAAAAASAPAHSGAPGGGAPTPAPVPGVPPPHAPAASPARAPTPPATQTHATIAPGAGSAGRSPTPPSATPGGNPAPAGDDDQPTEIIRQRPAGS